MKIAFIWQGISGRYGQWKDGLYQTMQIIGKKHDVHLFEPEGNIESFKPDWVLYWESPATAHGKDKKNWDKVCNLPFKKALLYAGGEVDAMAVKDFDHVFIESQVDMETCERLGIPHSRAFGINDEIMKSQIQPKIWDGMQQATCAAWKRTWLMTEALKEKSLVCGRFQEHDPACFERATTHGALVLPEQSAESVCSLLNASRCLVQTSSGQGGGQRATLEAIACGIPVIAMTDSPKNCEFVRESGYGLICEPKVEAIKESIKEIKSNQWNIDDGVSYIKKNWSAKKYADDLLKILE